MFKLRDYQVENSRKGCEILRQHKLLALMFECRVGKTLTALETARLYGAKSVLFLTKKKAMASIQSDYDALAPGYVIDIINHESMHKALGDYDFVVVDECHTYSAFPKPSARYKAFKERFSRLPIILVSATFTPENFSQIYHQFNLSDASPFREGNFYQWTKNYVNVRQRVLPQGTINDYTDGIEEKIMPMIEPYTLRFTQEQAGFIVQLHEHFCYVPMPRKLKDIAECLMRDAVVEGRTGTISAENAAALQQKVHQLHSGTILLDEVPDEKRQALVLSDAKARFIADNWPTEKLVIFYQFKAELLAIQSVLGDRITTDLKEFQNSNKSCAFQVVSGREGVDLSLGQIIVFYNISHSAVSYFQARDRLTTSSRRESHIYWLFSCFDQEPGLEKEIYDVVMSKKKYTVNHFRKGKCLNPKFKSGLSNSTKPKDFIPSKLSKQIRLASPTSY
jgi:hypothetical protein